MPRTKMKTNNAAPLPSRRILPIIIASLLALVLLFGIIAGSVVLISELTSAVSYKGTRLSPGVAAYLASTYKTTYKGNDLASATERYIRGVCVAAYLFDRTTSLGASDRKWIDENVAEILNYRADGDKKKFNELSAPLGFDYDDFRDAVEILYKAANAQPAIYGVNGSRLSYSENVSLLYEYMGGYSYVRILFIRTETRFAKDEAGNRIPGSGGNDLTVTLDEAERAERAADIAKIKELIENANAGSGIEMTVEEFERYYDKYNDDPEHAKGGYYFRAGTAFTEQYREEYPNLVDTILKTGIGKYDTSKDGETVCFIYKTSPIMTDFVSTDKAAFFTDFYPGAASYLMRKSVMELVEDVKFRDAYSKINLETIPPNNDFRTTLGIGVNFE